MNLVVSIFESYQYANHPHKLTTGHIYLLHHILQLDFR